MKIRNIYTYFLIASVFSILPFLASAHQPNLPEATTEVFVSGNIDLGLAVEVEDPTVTSQAIYDSLEKVGQIRLYKFNSEYNEKIPFEVLVPVRKSNKNFYPWVALIYKDGLLDRDDFKELPFDLPAGYDAILIKTLPETDREVFFEPFSFEKLYHGTEENIEMKSGEDYFVAVFEPNNQTGDFALGIGTKENFDETSFLGLVKDVLKIKLKLVSNPEIPWGEFWGLFLFLAGFVIGLGAVTVIDVHGFLGINSGYWTETTIRAHKVTKPLIWIGIVLASVGASIFYSAVGSGVSSVATFHIILFSILILNGMYLSFYISPFLLKREREGRAKELLPFKVKLGVGVSLIFSIIGWWGSLALLSWYLIFIL